MKDVLLQVDTLLKNAGKGSIPKVWLIFGDELLVQQACKKVVDSIVRKEKQSLNCQFMDAEHHSIGGVLESLNTYGLFPEPKVVVWQNDKILASAVIADDFLEKAVNALDEGRKDNAKRHLFAFMNIKKLTFEKLDPENLEEYMGDFGLELKQLVAELKAKRVRVPPYIDDSQMLMKAMDKGFAPENHLVITTVVVDKRKRLYKHIETNGAVVDCTVKSGDKKEEKAKLQAAAAQIVSQFEKSWSKKVDSRAVAALLELLETDLRALESNLAKLGVYVGQRPAISAKDVQDIVSRTRKDPVYLFTDALTDRKLDAALRFLNILFDDGFHYLAILAALGNQFRKLVGIKGFLEWAGGKVYSPGMRSNVFEKNIGDAPKRFDAMLDEALLQWTEAWSQTEEEDPDESAGDDGLDEEAPAAGKDKVKKMPLPIELGKMHPYSLYLACGKASLFSMEQLQQAFLLILETDRALKSTGQDHKLLVENLVISLCSL
jgi:DNA polymerase-3 subunit delta